MLWGGGDTAAITPIVLGGGIGGGGKVTIEEKLRIVRLKLRMIWRIFIINIRGWIPGLLEVGEYYLDRYKLGAYIPAGGVNRQNRPKLPTAPSLQNNLTIAKTDLNYQHNMQRPLSLQNSLFSLHPSVKNALSKSLPIIAFESTILTHGLPYPQNLDLAKSLASKCRANNIVPATIALNNGKVKVGLTPFELEQICLSPKNQPSSPPQKATTSLIGRVLSLSSADPTLWGGTTVASTSYIASLLQIKMFVTGGLGGVHRDLSPSSRINDVSADLFQLAKNPHPVIIISSGVKSILDIPNTLENLETLGVTVGAYKTVYFPRFYSEFDESIKSPIVWKNAKDVASTFFFNSRLLNEGGGLVCAVPKPEPELKANRGKRKDETEVFINQALQAAADQNITGKAITPFVLEMVKNLR